MIKSKRPFAALRPWFGALLPIKLRRGLVVLFCLLTLGFIGLVRWKATAATASQESPDGIWRSQAAEAIGLSKLQDNSPSARVFQLNDNALKDLLGRAPLEAIVPLRESPVVLTAPRADGSFARFHLVESPIMEPGLAARYPQIKTYLGQGIDDP